MLDFYGTLLLLIGVIIIQATNAKKGRFAATLLVAIVFSFSNFFIFADFKGLFLLLFVNTYLYLMMFACYFTRPRFITFWNKSMRPIFRSFLFFKFFSTIIYNDI